MNPSSGQNAAGGEPPTAPGSPSGKMRRLVVVSTDVTWNGWSLWLFGRHQTGLLPGQATHTLIDEGPYRVSRTRCTSACSLCISG